MKMTAEEFLNQQQFNPDVDISFEEYHGDIISWETERAMIAFAKHHVELALKVATEKATYNKGKYNAYNLIIVDKQSIIDSYPLSIII